MLNGRSSTSQECQLVREYVRKNWYFQINDSPNDVLTFKNWIRDEIIGTQDVQKNFLCHGMGSNGPGTGRMIFLVAAQLDSFSKSWQNHSHSRSKTRMIFTIPLMRSWSKIFSTYYYYFYHDIRVWVFCKKLSIKPAAIFIICEKREGLEAAWRDIAQPDSFAKRD